MANFKSVDYIITAKHYGGSAKGYIQKMQQDIHRQRGIAVTIKELDRPARGLPVKARIWQGQWIADCECKGACFVDPDEPIFFCFSCGNRANESRPRPVIFPPEAERREIERLLLERPVDDMAGLTDMERAGMARPLLYKEVEIIEPPSQVEIELAAISGVAPELRKSIVTLPLTRSWEPHETVADLAAQQKQSINQWRANLKRGDHGVQ